MQRVSVSGSPYQRGRQYGEQAAVLIRRSLEEYRGVFAHYARIEWSQALTAAAAYRPAITAFSPAIAQELDGIADGAGVARDDILALNTRSELMFAAAISTPGSAIAQECTSFAVLPEASATGGVLVGQNWDWLAFAGETLVYIDVRRDDGPDYVTICEAGLLAKMGFNAAGLGVCTNTLVTTRLDGDGGVPYHVMLRALLDATTMTDALRRLMQTRRALSANYMLAHADGLAVNAETMPGDATGVRLMLPEPGWITHANHFVDRDFAREDARLAPQPHSLFRQERMGRALGQMGAAGRTVKAIGAALGSHHNHPDGVCTHPTPGARRYEQRATLASVIADLASGELWVADGPPCVTPFERHAYRDELAARPQMRESA